MGALELASRDNLDFIKDKAIRALARLLRAKPEQEGRLLAALANKLGDPSRKLASKVLPPPCHPFFEQSVRCVVLSKAGSKGASSGLARSYVRNLCTR